MSFGIIIRWVLSGCFGLLGWWMIILNFAIAYRWFARREHHSWIPLVGGLFAFAGMGICPLLQVRRLAWIPIVVDVAYFFLALIIGFAMMYFERKKKGKVSSDKPNE